MDAERDIVFEDRRNGVRRREPAYNVPESIREVELDGARVPVARIVTFELDGATVIESYDAEGQRLMRTVGAPDRR